VLCELVLVEIYMQLRNPAILRTPLSAVAAADFCDCLRANPEWQLVDYEPAVSERLWRWARSTSSAFRRILKRSGWFQAALAAGNCWPCHKYWDGLSGRTV